MMCYMNNVLGHVLCQQWTISIFECVFFFLSLVVATTTHPIRDWYTHSKNQILFFSSVYYKCLMSKQFFNAHQHVVASFLRVSFEITAQASHSIRSNLFQECVGFFSFDRLLLLFCRCCFSSFASSFCTPSITLEDQPKVYSVFSWFAWTSLKWW